jgi:hypothetical protein
MIQAVSDEYRFNHNHYYESQKKAIQNNGLTPSPPLSPNLANSPILPQAAIRIRTPLDHSKVSPHTVPYMRYNRVVIGLCRQCVCLGRRTTT